MRPSPLLVLCACALLLAPLSFARAQDASSTGEAGAAPAPVDTAVPAPAPAEASSSTAAALGPTAPLNGSTGAAGGGGGGPAPRPIALKTCKRDHVDEQGQPMFTCGCQEVTANGTAADGAFWDGAPWRTNDLSYIDKTLANAGPFSNATRSRGYAQCYGGSTTLNCLDHFNAAGVIAAAEGGFPRPGYSSGLFCQQTVPLGGTRFIKGQQAPEICVVYGGGNRLRRMRWFPKIDQFALLAVQDSFNSTEGIVQFGHLGTTFQVEINGVKSPVRHRYGTATNTVCLAQVDPVTGLDIPVDREHPCVFSTGIICTVVPFHTIIINLDQGRLTSIDFDDDCSLCRNDFCVDGNCAIPISECKSSQTYDNTNTAQATDCEFKLYVSWQGTDSEGTFLSSSGRRLSQFRRWSLNAVYNQASNFDTADLPVVPPDE